MAELTERQRQVLDALLCGLTNEQIAQELGIAAQTVNEHLMSVYKKWNLPNHNRTSAAMLHMIEKHRATILAMGS